ncbi:MAG TPA: hypothetical protein VM261_17070, partial [Kofleriaceae bacterium]|nr:hypothetical protein [Kofleriaceae bacterium]
LVRLADDVWVKRAMIALTVAVHVVVAWKYVPAYREAHRYGELRMQQLSAPPPGGIATITPFPQVGIGFWFLGEDLGSSTSRETAAIEVFDLEDIVFDRETGAYEPSTGLEMHVEVDFDPQPTREEVQRLIGRRVARNLIVARGQFRRMLVELGRTSHVHGGSLVVDNLEWPQRNGRPVYAGRFAQGTGMVIPEAYWLQPDSLQRMRFRVNWRSVGTEHEPVREELYVIGMGDVFPTKRGTRYVYFVPRWAGTYVLVACGPDDCYVVESAWARY